MIYDKDKINRIIDFKDNLLDCSIQKDIEWLISCYNDYYVNSKEYEEKISNYNKLLNKYYAVEDEKASFKEMVIRLKRRNRSLEEQYELVARNKKVCYNLRKEKKNEK